MGFRPEGRLLVNTLENAQTDGLLQPAHFADFPKLLTKNTQF